ncbi:MAG: 3-deoxy-manno-octulosonate cytidylyltransferase [Bacteroidota bacterium]|nr:3-deoxy-manno-octulosonate cytidylyltransferase [Bacteroidota bacterium]
MKIIAVIPARYNSTRFPAKLMQDLNGKTVIRHTYENAKKTALFDEVFVVTDSDIIATEIASVGGKVIMSVKQHESGSDRIAEAVQNMDVDIVVNIQGDEPLIDKDSLKKINDLFRQDVDKKIDLASIMREIKEQKDIENPNNVKVIVDKMGYALYFSRSVIPYKREQNTDVRYYQHIGVYAFRKEALMEFYGLEVSPLELAEKLEQLRYLENGRRIRMIETTHVGIGIDTLEDLERARKLLK